MPIQFDTTQLGEVNDNLDALDTRFPSLDWTYNSDNSSTIKYRGALPSPYNGSSHAMEIEIPVTTSGDLTYTATAFRFTSTGNLKLEFPEPNSATRTAMTSIVEVGDWVEDFIDSMT